MRRFIKACTLSAIFLTLSATAASAQINYGAEVKIPFTFAVRDKVHAPGTYVIKINRQIKGGATLTIQNAHSSDIQTILLTEVRGAGSNEVTLVFRGEAGSRYLAGVTTSNNSYAFVRARAPSVNALPVGEDIGSGANLY